MDLACYLVIIVAQKRPPRPQHIFKFPLNFRPTKSKSSTLDLWSNTIIQTPFLVPGQAQPQQSVIAYGKETGAVKATGEGRIRVCGDANCEVTNPEHFGDMLEEPGRPSSSYCSMSFRWRSFSFMNTFCQHRISPNVTFQIISPQAALHSTFILTRQTRS